MLEIVAYTIAAIAIYMVSDAILRQVEQRRAEPLANRSVVFFIIILTIAIITFAIIRSFLQ